jgi:hypothetical protein
MSTVVALTACAAVALVACAALLSGCSNSCSWEPSESDGYLEPISPENVLANFCRAYNERNADELLDCFSEDFRFYFTEEDQQGWPQFPPWFYKADEQQVHGNMFGDDWGVESISLTMTPMSVEAAPELEGGAARDSVVTIRVSADLRINLHGDLTYIATTPQEFLFRIAAGGDAVGGRAEWEMFEWYEDEVHTGGRVEEAGWGGIKFCFLEELSQQARRTSPAEVIEQLETAYVAEDLESYLDCLSEDFIFYPTAGDVQNPQNPLPPEWYKTDERTMHTNMFDEGSNVVAISLTLSTTSVEHDLGDPQDPLDDTYAHMEGVDLRVNLIQDLTLLATEPSEFHIRVDQDEEGPYGEVMWEIYEWYELGWGRASVTEDVTWGGIKAMYR